MLLEGAPKLNKTAGLQWTAHPKPDLALMAESLMSLMGLIDKAWTDRADMRKWVIDGILSVCPEDAELGVAGGALEGLHLALCHGTADALVCQDVVSLQ